MPSAWAQLRQIMYLPSEAWLATEYSGDRWLTDQYVLYNVTGLDELYCYGSSYGIEWPDGPYKLTVSQGLKPRDAAPAPDIEAYFRRVAGRLWSVAEPTEWSVAEHPGKAMLWVAGGEPCLLGEPTWTAIKRYHPEAVVRWGPSKGAGVFCFSEPYQGTGEIAPFAFAASIQIPEGQEGVAYAIAQALDRTSNEEAA